MNDLEGKRILVTGGTGSLGQTLVRRILSGEMGTPESVTVFSRDEAKQHYMRLDFLHREIATDDVIYQNAQNKLKYRIGDVRDYSSLLAAIRNADIVFITDDYCDVTPEFVEEFERKKRTMDVKVFSVIVGARADDARTLRKFSDRVLSAEQFDESVVEQIFDAI